MAPTIDDSTLGVPTGLADAGNTVRSISNTLGAELHQLGQKIAAIMVTWDGDTADHFAPFMVQWQNAAHALWGDDGAPVPMPGGQVPDGVDRPGADMGMLPFIAHALDKLYENYMNAEFANGKTWMMN
jgi:hypothetical protein